jgi:hypothetical protein
MGKRLRKSMEYKQAVDVLKRLVEKHPLNAEEKEAVMTAIGVLAWGSLGKSKTRAIKAKKDEKMRW